MITYFQNHMTSDEIKSEYRRLAMKFHPDHGGDTIKMQEINAAYAFAVDRATRIEKPGKTEQEYADLEAVNEALRKAILAIIHLPEIEIEICGLWVWVSGNTKPVKETLKAAGYWWANKKAKWYFAGVRAHSRGDVDMDEIRERYGSQKVETHPHLGLNGA